MEDARSKPRHRWPLYSFFALVALTGFLASRVVCPGAFLFDGIAVPECPDGQPRQTLWISADGLRRGAEGQLSLGATAHYTTERADVDLTAEVRRLSADVVLVKGKGEEVPLEPKKGWRDDGDHALRGAVTLPELPDGEYTLRARVRTPLGEDTIELPLPVLAPARVHVITDRPLYQPGDTVHFRAVVLRAKDLAPLDGRPGKWIVEDPSRETVLEEKAAAGEWGVVAGSFPLDAGAEHGTWRVRWSSGGAEDAVSFSVEPFTLPRFRVEASAAKAYYRAGERPVLRGRVVYSSGAPVKDAHVMFAWSVSGDWPPPARWLDAELPKLAKADASGKFELTLPVVPGDLRGRATLVAQLSATDGTGDRVEGSASVLLVEHAIEVSAVTELAGGLVQGFNNRLYLRATMADGAVLRGTELVVRRAWDPSDQGVTTKTDEDGVAALQLDPGPPVNVVIPPMPYRPPPRPPAVRRGEVHELVGDGAASLRDQLTMDGWTTTLAPCARFVASGSQSLALGVRVEASGTISAVAGDEGPLARCAGAILERSALSAGEPRVLHVELTFTSDLPVLQPEVEGAPGVPDGVEAVLARAALDARSCLPDELPAGPLPRMILWTVGPKSKELAVTWVRDPRATEAAVPASVEACVEAKLAKLPLPRSAAPGAEPTPVEALAELGEGASSARSGAGVARFTVVPRESAEGMRPQATTLLGYELQVTARREKEELGQTKLVLQPGAVPDVRLRATPVLAEPGSAVEVAILRGPGFTGAIPEKLWMRWELGSIEAKVDPKTRIARFELPAEARGWFETSWSSGRAVVYVRPRAELTLEAAPAKAEYRPGEKAEILLTTTAGGKPTRAAVGLFGVDQSLGQIATLAGPDELARLRPVPTMSSPAFAVLDGAALALGRIRGANAAAATILRVASLPEHAELDAAISASNRASFEPVEALTDHFYPVLAELHAQVRAWEASAPEGEQVRPATMAKLWSAALDACEKRKEPVTDAYGRRLRLHRLPGDLLALTDPRVVVVNGTRLPEDVESWPAWVQKEQP